MVRIGANARWMASEVRSTVEVWWMGSVEERGGGSAERSHAHSGTPENEIRDGV